MWYLARSWPNATILWRETGTKPISSHSSFWGLDVIGHTEWWRSHNVQFFDDFSIMIQTHSKMIIWCPENRLCFFMKFFHFFSRQCLQTLSSFSVLRSKYWISYQIFNLRITFGKTLINYQHIRISPTFINAMSFLYFKDCTLRDGSMILLMSPDYEGTHLYEFQYYKLPLHLEDIVLQLNPSRCNKSSSTFIMSMHMRSHHVGKFSLSSSISPVYSFLAVEHRFCNMAWQNVRIKITWLSTFYEV